MAFNRRHFLSKFSGVAGTLATSSLISPVLANNLAKAFQGIQKLSIEEAVRDEEFWYQIKLAYTVSSTFLNLNNGGVSPQPKVVQDAVERFNKISNEAPSFHMWHLLDRDRKIIRQKLADLAGCSSEEIAINRNASEALETVIFGLRLKAGDEVILTKQDYPNMINAWKQRAHRDGIILKWLDFDFPITDKSLIINRFKAAFTEKTKIVHLTHKINWCGQLMPAKEIIKAAHDHGIEVILDAAHTFAHIDYNLYDLDCDYMGTSLHDFHLMIGAERKQKRLFYLKDYWTKKVADIPQIKIHTPASEDLSGAICLFSVEGMDSTKIFRTLHSKYRIHAVVINWENLHGIRIVPNVYTVTKDLDRFVEVLREIINSGE